MIAVDVSKTSFAFCCVALGVVIGGGFTNPACVLVGAAVGILIATIGICTGYVGD